MNTLNELKQMQYEIKELKRQRDLYLRDRDVVMEQRDQARQQVDELKKCCEELEQAVHLLNSFDAPVELQKERAAVEQLRRENNELQEQLRIADEADRVMQDDFNGRIDSLSRELNEARKDSERLSEIGKRLRTQDNRITQNPMFCVQEKRCDVGYDAIAQEAKNEK